MEGQNEHQSRSTLPIPDRREMEAHVFDDAGAASERGFGDHLTSKLLAELLHFAIGLAIAAGCNRRLHTVSRITEAVRNALAFSAAFAIIAAVVLLTASTTSGGLVDDHTKSLDGISGL